METSVLDDEAATAKIDQGSMLHVLEKTPGAYFQSYIALKSKTPPTTLTLPASQVTLVGVGGSAITADILKDWLFESPTAFQVIRGARLPGSVGRRACVLVASYSGQTAEALNALREALRRKSRVSCVTSGGEMLETCRKERIDHVQVTGGLQPREALPQLLSASLVILEKWGVCNHRQVRSELKAATQQLVELRSRIGFAQPQAGNTAKQLAVQLHGKIPFIYSSLLLQAAARRFKNQLNENAKLLAKFEVLPELLHNEVQGWRMLGEATVADSTAFVLLRGCETDHETTQFNRLTELIRQAGGKTVHEISQNSPRRLASILATIYYCDYVSFYLAILRGVDPTPIETIWRLKRGT